MGESGEFSWETAPANPDFETDLGYEHELLVSIHLDEADERYIFLPEDEDHLADDEFVIAAAPVVEDLDDWR